MGRPSTPMETYLRLMFLKFRYRLGYESLCREVSDSITWRQFCRIGIDQPVPHPTTLMKLTTRCGSVGGRRVERGSAGEGGRGEGAAHHQDQGRHHRGACERRVSDRLRSAGQGGQPDRDDRTTDPGRRWRGPHQAAGPVPRRGQRAHDLNAKLRTRNAAAKDEALAVVRRKNLELADLAETAAAEAERLLANAKRAIRTAKKKAAQLKAEGRSDAGGRTPARSAGPGGERPHRAAGRDPTDRRSDPAADGRHHPRRRHPTGQPARPRRPPDRERPTRQAGRVRSQSPGLRQRRRDRPRPRRPTRQPRRRTPAEARRRTGQETDRADTTHGGRRPRLRRSQCR